MVPATQPGEKDRNCMLKNLSKVIICSLATFGIAKSAISGGCEGRDTTPVYVVYQMGTERPQTLYSTSRTYYSCTVEYRQVTEYSQTTRCEEQSRRREYPMQHVCYTYVDP
jgi:hypothetical protein